MQGGGSKSDGPKDSPLRMRFQPSFLSERRVGGQHLAINHPTGKSSCGLAGENQPARAPHVNIKDLSKRPFGWTARP